jgi:hypothetical protein
MDEDTESALFRVQRGCLTVTKDQQTEAIEAQTQTSGRPLYEAPRLVRAATLTKAGIPQPPVSAE